MMQRFDVWFNIGAVIIALMVVHCFGRFVFTPLMPFLIDDGILTLAQSTDLASINYLGYFVGAVIAIFLSSPRYTKPLILSNLLFSLVTTIWQCFTSEFSTLLVLRLCNGIANGVVFVLAPAFVLEWLHQQGKAHLSGYMYFGVSLGLLVTGLLVNITADHFQGIERWQPIAIIATLLGLLSFFRLLTLQVVLPSIDNQHDTPPLFNASTTPLFFAYLGAGLGYILPMTFLPTLTYQLYPEHAINPYIWTVVAVMSVISTPIWNIIGHRFSDHTALNLTYILQAIGILSLFIFQHIGGILLCAMLIGGSFLGSVICTQRYARALQPKQGIKLSACLISIYSIAQLIAPILTKYWLQYGGHLYLSFTLGLMAFIFSLLCMWKIPRAVE